MTLKRKPEFRRKFKEIPLLVHHYTLAGKTLYRVSVTVARVTGLEPAASAVTGRRSNQLSYTRASEVGLINSFALGLSSAICALFWLYAAFAAKSCSGGIYLRFSDLATASFVTCPCAILRPLRKLISPLSASFQPLSANVMAYGITE